MKLIQLFKGYDNVLYIHAVSPSKFGLVESEPYYSINLDIELEQNLILSYINNALIGSLNEKIFAEDVNPRERDKLQSPLWDMAKVSSYSQFYKKIEKCLFLTEENKQYEISPTKKKGNRSFSALSKKSTIIKDSYFEENPIKYLNEAFNLCE
ncbi:hypothetical protein [Runella salmonicolor]|uniref:Uncharacterized protein n=1 Tax=Runella salmonicolor TaxID=2950278 RepID=A0ABT1FW69_9BACT|nr:hypothetical protein [Runella salmonicolor]MCP1385715.1 hypothetical protein [Runella salmonicolor]